MQDKINMIGHEAKIVYFIHMVGHIWTYTYGKNVIKLRKSSSSLPNTCTNLENNMRGQYGHIMYNWLFTVVIYNLQCYSYIFRVKFGMAIL